jgi:hypothetical protein
MLHELPNELFEDFKFVMNEKIQGMNNLEQFLKFLQKTGVLKPQQVVNLLVLRDYDLFVKNGRTISQNEWIMQTSIKYDPMSETAIRNIIYNKHKELKEFRKGG